MKPSSTAIRSFWLKLKLLMAMAQCGALTRRGSKRDLHRNRRRTRTFFEMP